MAFDAATSRPTSGPPAAVQADMLSEADDQERARRDAEVDEQVTPSSTMYPDLVAALGELGETAKRKVADTGTYSYGYADLGDVLGDVRPVLRRHHLGLSQYVVTNSYDRTVTVATRLLHVSGDHYAAGRLTYPLPPNIQQLGSLITYLRRYSIGAALGIGTVDDDDGQEAAKPVAKPAKSTRGVSQTQIRKIGALMDEAGINKDAAARRQLVSDLIGRQIQTRNDLTADEATVVIDAMTRLVAGQVTIEIAEDGSWRLTEHEP